MSSTYTTNESSGKIRLILPETIYAVPGMEMNVYFDNVVLVINPENYVFDVKCKKGIQQSKRWTYIPITEDVGNYPFEIQVKDDQNNIIAEAKSRLCVIPSDAGRGQSPTLLCIGDSFTHESVYTDQLLKLSGQPGNPQLNLVGTHRPFEKYPVENRHEGYGGWTAEHFVTEYNENARTGPAADRGSPFLYPVENGKPSLDFSHYLQDTSQGKVPDIVTIFLGCNDVFHATDNDIEEVITKALGFYDKLVAMIHEVDQNIKIGAVLIPPPAATQDAFGISYSCTQTRWQFKRNQHRLVERLAQHFGKRQNENIFLIPVFTNLDCQHNYPTETTCCNSQTTQTEIRQNNGLHPAEEGYRQIGDTIYCWIKAILPSNEK